MRSLRRRRNASTMDAVSAGMPPARRSRKRRRREPASGVETPATQAEVAVVTSCASWLPGFVVAQLLDGSYCLLSES